MSWRDIRVLWTREVRAALRERSVVVNSILLPVVLYPLLLWIEISAIAFVSGMTERTPARVAVVADAEARHEAVVDALEAAPDGRIEIVATGPSPADPLRRLDEREVDAVVEVEPPANPSARLPEDARIMVHFDRSRAASRRALDRVEAAVGELREARLERAAAGLGLPPGATHPIRVEMVDVSSEEDLGATVLGLMIPLFLVISVALGCLVPAIDATAGERERGTWETLMTTRASRGSLVTAKYLYVATFGTAAGILNVTALSLSLGPMMAPLQGMEGGPELVVRLAPAALAVMAGGAVVLGLFFAAAMMPLAAFARTFKDGQALVTPVVYLAFLPLLLGQQSDRTLTPALAAVPVANVAMAVRDAIRGVFDWPLLGVTAGVSAALIVACLALARWMLGFEDFAMGSHAGSPWRFLRERRSAR